MGAVYEGTHVATNTPVALKFVRANTRAERTLLENEIWAMARLNHPHLLYLYDYGRRGDETWMALERASGGTFDPSRIQSFEDVLAAANAVLQGLGHAHSHGVVHRDIKPDNLLWTLEHDLRPGLKVADFGMAFALRDHKGPSRGGTPLYMPPEQISREHGRVGPWSDLYALGGMMWEWVVGRPPLDRGGWKATLDAQVNDPLPQFEPRFEVPPGFDEMLHWMLAKQTSERPRRARQVEDALADLRGRKRSPWVFTVPAPATPLPGVGADLLGLRRPGLVGRSSELGELWSHLVSAIRTRTTVVVQVTGPRGSGSRRLLETVFALADQAGIRTTRSWKEASERAEGEAAVWLATTDDIAGVVEAAFSKGPLVVLLPGLQPASELNHIPGVVSSSLGPVDKGAIRSLLHQELGLEARQAFQLATRTSGNPGEALRWVRHVARLGGWMATPDGFVASALLDVPPTTDADAALFEHTWSMLDVGSRRTLIVGAHMGKDVPVGRWMTVLGEMGLSNRQHGLRTFVRAGLATRSQHGWRFVSPSIASTVAACARDSTSIHRSILAVVQVADPTDARSLGRHLLGVGRVREAADQWISCLEQTGEQEIEILSEFVDRLREQEDQLTPMQRLRLVGQHMKAVKNLMSAVDAVPLARELLERSQDVPATEERHEYVVSAAQVLVFASRLDEAEEVLDALPPAFGEHPRLRALIAGDRGDHVSAMAILHRWFEAAESTDHIRRSRAANGIGNNAGRSGYPERALEWFDVALAEIEPHLHYVIQGNRGMALMELGRFEEAVVACRISRESARGRGAHRMGVATLVHCVASAGAADERGCRQSEALAIHTARHQTVDDRQLLLDIVRRRRREGKGLDRYLVSLESALVHGG